MLTQENIAQWDRELVELAMKVGYNPNAVAPEIPEGISFPVMVVFHRKRVSDRNSVYLMACAITGLSALCVLQRNMKHKGWPTMTLLFDLPDWMLEAQQQCNRYLLWKFQNWDAIAPLLSADDRVLLPDLKELFPCPATQVKDKKGQYRLVF